MRGRGFAAGFASLFALGGAACHSNEPVYFPAPSPIEVGGGADEAAAGSASLSLPFRPPSEEEQARLREESDRREVDVPWLRAEDVALSLLYTITNLGDRTASARLEIDGASEFASYDSAALRAAAALANPEEDEPVVLALIRPRPVRLAPGEVHTGTVREDDFDEAALDLDAIGRFMAVPAEVLVNRSDVHPVGLEMVPPLHIVPALYRLEVLFSAETHMRLEFLLRVRDDAHQLLREQGEVFEPEPTPYAPVVAAP